MKTLWSFLEKKRHTFVFAAILVFGILAYGQSLSAPFYLDDYSRIVDNSFIKHFNTALLWAYDPSRFLTNLSFNINFLIFRFNLISWHLFNLAVHVLNAYLVYRLTALTFQTPRLLGRYAPNEQILIAIVTSFIFLLHPAQTQAVIYLVQRSTLLAALFYLLTVYFYARARAGHGGKFYFLAIGSAFLGMFTKPSFMTLPLAVALYDICFFGLDKRVDIKRSCIYFLLALPSLLIPFLVWKSGVLTHDAVNGFIAGDYWAHLWTSFKVPMTFLRLLIFPVGLNIDYDYPVSHSLFDLPALFSFAAVIGLGVIAWKAFRKEPWITFCIFWFFIALGAHTAIFPLADFIYEHWLYLSCYGFSFGAALLFIHIFRKPQRYAAVAGFLLMAMFILTSQRSRLWADPIAFLNDSAAKSPKKARVFNNLAIAYRQQGKTDEAKKNFEKAIAFDPSYYLSQSNLASIYIMEEQFDKAKTLLEKAVQYKPDSVEAYFNLGNLYAQQGKYDQAIFYLNRARFLNSNYALVRMGLGNLYEKIGNLAMARQELSSALWLDPENAKIYYNLGNVNFQLKNFYEAMINYNEAIRRKPDLNEACNNLGHIYFYFQDYKKAKDQYQRSIDLAPYLPEGHFYLGNVLYQMGQTGESKVAIQTAIRLYREEGRDDIANSLQSKLDVLN